MSESNGVQRPSGAGVNEPHAAALEALLLDQCLRWRRGQRVLVEVYLAEHPGVRADVEAALDLIGNEMLLRQERDERLELEEYLGRFPKWAAPIRDQFEVDRAIQEAVPPASTWRRTEGATSPGYIPPLPAGPAALPAIPGYEILGELGRGGMGVVYRARQAGLGRLVALKMIPPGTYAGREELARFRREAEAVARFRHPNIVQIHEVGEQDGRPFFSLELVEGGTLAEKMRGTPQPARKAAELVEVLARAMHRAHQQGIVHRDLKPANVLLTEDGTLKITDFGLAKRLEGGEAHTQSGAILGTPSYMAPEQARGLTHQVGPAADVYGLGAILYECLTGRPPFQGETPWDVVMQVLSEDLVPPRRLQPKCPRDLETICLTCLHKEQKKRYPSALALAEDLHRFLGRHPIQARSAGPVERLARWSGRHPGVATLLATLLIVLTAGFTGMTLLWWRADEARRKEARGFRDLLGVVDKYLTRVSESRLLNEPGLQPLRKELLQEAQQHYEKIVRERGNDPSARAELAKVYRCLAKITHSIGSKVEALELARQAVTLGERLVEDAPGDVEAQRELAASHHALGLLYAASQKTREAQAAHEQALAIRERVAEGRPDDPDLQRDLAQSQHSLGQLFYNTGQLARAEASYRNALATCAKLVEIDPTEPGHKRSLALTTNDLGLLCAATGRAAEAEKLHHKALALRQPLAGAHPDNLGYQQDLATSHYRLAILYEETGRGSLAENAYRQALAINERLARSNPAVTFYQSDLALYQRGLASLLLENGRLDQARTIYLDARTLLTKLTQDHPTIPTFRRTLAATWSDLGGLHQRSARMADAETAYGEARTILLGLTKAHPDIPEHQCYLALVDWNLGSVAHKMNRLEKAEAAYREALAIQERLTRRHPTTTQYHSQLAESCHTLAILYKEAGRTDESEKSFARALVVRKKLADENPTIPDFRANLADTHDGQGDLFRKTGRTELALAAYREALAVREELITRHPKVPYYRSQLSNSYHNLGVLYQVGKPFRPAEAEAAYRKALALREELARDHPQEWRFAVKAGGTCLNLGILLRTTKRPEAALDCYGRAIHFLEPVVRKERNLGDARPWLGSAHEERALVLEGMGRRKEASSDWERALELADDGSRAQLRLHRAMNLAHLGEHARACAEADELAKAETLPAGTLYDWARVYSLSSAAAGEDGNRALEGRHADSAVEVLRRGIGKGYRDKAHLEKDPDLSPLRSRDDFRNLLAELQKKAVP